MEDTAPDRICRFRVTGNIDETIVSKDPQDYVAFWGIVYDEARVERVYDVKRQLLLDCAFYTQDQYWAYMELRWAKERARKNEQTGDRGDVSQ